MLRSTLFIAALCAASVCAASSRPPVSESLDLTLVTLNHMQLEPLRERDAGLLPLKAKDLPNSVRLYLRPSGQLDSLSAAVGRAAAGVRRAMAPGSRQKDALRDSRHVVRALGLWLDTHLLAASGPDPASRPCLDLRMAYPKASALLKEGVTDANGRALVAVAMLRALKVPARMATARGSLVVQYWVSEKAPARPALRRRGRHGYARSKGPQTPVGWWECMDPGVMDAEIDAWSLDASSLARLRWKPKQQLGVSLVGWERAAFDGGDSLAAHAAFDDALGAGRLKVGTRAQSLSVVAGSVLQSLTRGASTVWVLTAQHWRLRTEGAMDGMQSVQILSPYRPDLSSWGREQRGPVRGSDIEAEGLWSDRPSRLRLHTDLRDEWASPPPALGILHWYDLGVRRPLDILQAYREDGRVTGVVLRTGNLTPLRGWKLTVSAEGTTQSAESSVGEDGQFVLPLDTVLDQAPCLNVSVYGPNGETDTQRLLLGYPGQP
jgi:hypothetical protein